MYMYFTIYKIVVLGVVIPQDGITCLMENISVMLALITCIAGKIVHIS